MTSFACYWPWLFGGLIGGWLLWQLFDRMFRRDGEAAGIRVRRDLEVAHSRVGSLQGQLAASAEQVKVLRTDVDAMGETVRMRTDAVTRLEAECAEWQSRHAALEVSATEQSSRLELAGAAAVAAAAAALAAATAKYTSLRGDLDAATATIAGHVTAQGTLTKELESAKGTIAGHLETHSSLTGELNASRVSFAGLQEETHSVTSKYDGVSGELNASRTALAALQQELAAATATVAGHVSRQQELDTELSGSQKTVTALRQELEAGTARRTVLEEEMTRTAALAESARAFASAAEFGFTPRRSGRDDLLIIEGIGPKINELLLTGGIDTFATLALTPVTQVQAILDAAGPNFRLANPASWARQSAMCEAGEWSALRSYQDTLRAGVDAGRGSPQTEEQRLAAAAAFGFVPRRFGRDDLTIVEGIGPKINEVLAAAGIDTFAKLAAAAVDRVKASLDRAGPNFRLANPASWAQQSALCESGQWGALKTLQDGLQAGVDTGPRGDA